MRKLKLSFSCVVAICTPFSDGLTEKIGALYPEEVKPIVVKVLEHAHQQSSSQCGTSFPPLSQWFNILEKITEGDLVANLRPKYPELSVLCALKGAAIHIMGTQDDSDCLNTRLISLLEKSLTVLEVTQLRNAYFNRVVVWPNNDCLDFLRSKDCLKFLRSPEACSYKHIICENRLHRNLRSKR
jgi:hypothetical protein